MHRYSLYLLCALALMGCQTTQQGKEVGGLLKRGGINLGLLYSYEGIKRDFDSGRIMQARERALAMDKSHKDYEQVRKLLNGKIEPARKRLLAHYLGEAKKAEDNGLWHSAAQSYEQAKEVSLNADEVEKKRLQVEFKVRQARLDVLLRQRRAEDDFLLRLASGYEAPLGVSPADDVFLSRREQYEDELNQRASKAYRDAWRYQRKGMPEVAYVDIESYLRLQPDSERGKKLMAEIRQAMPPELSIAAANVAVVVGEPSKPTAVKKVPAKRVIVPETVTADQIRVTMKRGEWLQAKQYALVYRREGGKDADTLLSRIQVAIEKEAAAEFAKGGEYFRQEQLDQAISHWNRAVTLMPEEAEYVEALRRARQLKERLTLLRSGGGASNGE